MDDKVCCCTNFSQAFSILVCQWGIRQLTGQRTLYLPFYVYVSGIKIHNIALLDNIEKALASL